ncbi:hypothetical protein L1887_55158 [Cichorium endivia]|nr:hypothetical protein L1887_55158 [Cichorium endivia]
MFQIIARRIPAPMATWGKASGRRNLKEDSSARQHNDTGPGTANSSSEPAPHPSETSSRCATGMCQTAHRFEPPNSGLGGLHLPARAAGAHLAMRMRT